MPKRCLKLMVFLSRDSQATVLLSPQLLAYVVLKSPAGDSCSSWDQLSIQIHPQNENSQARVGLVFLTTNFALSCCNPGKSTHVSQASGWASGHLHNLLATVCRKCFGLVSLLPVREVLHLQALGFSGFCEDSGWCCDELVAGVVMSMVRTPVIVKDYYFLKLFPILKGFQEDYIKIVFKVRKLLKRGCRTSR